MDKVCSKCQEKKDILLFKFKNNKPCSQCKECVNKNHAIWLSNNPEKKNKYEQKRKNSGVYHKRRSRLKEEILIKRANNCCLKCGVSLSDRIRSTKYCLECKKERTKELKKKEYVKNINSYKLYHSKNKEKIRSYSKGKEQIRRNNLSDRYIRKLLREKNGYTVDQLSDNPELIEIKKIIIKTMRLCKTLKN